MVVRRTRLTNPMECDDPGTEDHDYVRVDQISGGGGGLVNALMVVAAANIDNPTELASETGEYVGQLCVVYDVNANLDDQSLYAWDAAVSDSTNSPYLIRSGSGGWRAVGGKNQYLNISVLGDIGVSGQVSADSLIVNTDAELNGLVTVVAPVNVTGILTFSTQPFVSAARTSSLTVDNSGDTAVTTFTENFDQGSNFASIPGEFTAPAAGIYSVRAQCSGTVDTPSDAALVSLKIKKNGSTTGSQTAPLNADNFIVTAIGDFQLAALDVLTFALAQDSAGDITSTVFGVGINKAA